MLNEQINEQLGLLQNELSRLKSVTNYIDDTNAKTQEIIEELEQIQKSYTVYTDKMFNLHKQYAEDIKNDTNIKVSEGVLNFETTGNKIDTTNREKLVETKKLLQQYKKITDATNNLVDTIKAVDFPIRLGQIDEEVETIHSILKEVENNQTDRKKTLEEQNKEIKTIKILLFVIIAIIVVGALVTILSLK